MSEGEWRERGGRGEGVSKDAAPRKEKGGGDK